MSQDFKLICQHSQEGAAEFTQRGGLLFFLFCWVGHFLPVIVDPLFCIVWTIAHRWVGGCVHRVDIDLPRLVALRRVYPLGTDDLSSDFDGRDFVQRLLLGWGDVTGDGLDGHRADIAVVHGVKALELCVADHFVFLGGGHVCCATHGVGAYDAPDGRRCIGLWCHHDWVAHHHTSRSGDDV